MSARSRPVAGRASAAVTVALVLAACAASVAPASAERKPKPPPPRYLFAGIPWRTPADSAGAALAARGYQLVPGAGAAHEIACRGQLYDHMAVVTGYLDEGRRLLRWVVTIGPGADPYPYPRMRKVYEDVVAEATGKYGPPARVVNAFHFPYNPHDGTQERALAQGKATIRTLWQSKSGDRLTVEMDRTTAVRMHYESPEWAKVVAKRKARKGADL
jgi:hypothetical protein